MKLKQLRLNHKVLHELTLNFSDRSEQIFDRRYGLHFLVGVNGTGKSTLMRALFEIFRRVQRGEEPLFRFHLEYELGVGAERRDCLISNWDGTLTYQVRGQETREGLLPERTLAFTSGAEREWLPHRAVLTTPKPGSAHTIEKLSGAERFLRERPGHMGTAVAEQNGANSGLVRLIHSESLPIVVLAGWLSESAAAQQREQDDGTLHERPLADVFKAARFQGLAGFSLRFRLPTDGDSSERTTMAELARFAVRRLRQGAERLLVFDLTQSGLARKILEPFGSGFAFFEAVERLSQARGDEPALLQEVNLFLERQPPEVVQSQPTPEPEKLHLFDWLSDGERSFLGRMGLFSILGDMESLIILDEPEVHFNDYWKRQIVYYMDQALRNHPKRSHVLITTHSTMALTDAHSDEVLVLDRKGAHTGQATDPGVETFAADPSDLLVSVFDAEQSAGRYTVKVINDMLTKDPGGEQRKSRLTALAEATAPGYWNYRIRRELQRLEDKER